MVSILAQREQGAYSLSGPAGTGGAIFRPDDPPLMGHGCAPADEGLSIASAVLFT
jgi:hypothetical protein